LLKTHTYSFAIKRDIHRTILSVIRSCLSSLVSFTSIVYPMNSPGARIYCEGRVQEPSFTMSISARIDHQPPPLRLGHPPVPKKRGNRQCRPPANYIGWPPLYRLLLSRLGPRRRFARHASRQRGRHVPLFITGSRNDSHNQQPSWSLKRPA
jgi:hypothetical protein